ncbi:phosphoenolpyruvate synthase, partial [Candidatus Woesearchaeota archaeon]|nr:phosphoenolpyruvate synthase [Candidatus Woesearchaeota archaeon]
MKILVLLGEIGKDDTLLAGGKGAQLGELKKSGFNVPEGFVITTEFYKMFVEKTGLSKAIQEILSNLDAGNNNGFEEASKSIHSLIISTDLPEDAENGIINAYKKLNALVAVRSSATAEDQKEASFAGQMATFLNVTESSLIESVKKCIASLFTPRAICYRKQKKIGYMNVSMAVVVQKMVNSERAGVAFSLNPVSNNAKEIVIEAASGLGE